MKDSMMKISVNKERALNENTIIKKKICKTALVFHIIRKNSMFHGLMNKVLLFTSYVFYPPKVYDIISNALGRDNPDDRLVKILFFLINFFLVNFFVISIISLLILITKTFREKKTRQLSEFFQDRLAEYILYEGEVETMIKEFRKYVIPDLREKCLLDKY